MLDSNAMNELESWLKTLTPAQSLRSDPDAMAKEIGMIAETMKRAGADSASRVKSVFQEIKRTSDHRAWPTAKEIIDTVSRLRGDRAAGRSGDKSKLTFDELDLLENKILPTARRWLGIPGLRSHGKQTLEYWGESVQ